MFGRRLIGLLSFFLKTGLTSAYFKPGRKEELDKEFLKL